MTVAVRREVVRQCAAAADSLSSDPNAPMPTAEEIQLAGAEWIRLAIHALRGPQTEEEEVPDTFDLSGNPVQSFEVFLKKYSVI